MSGTHFYKVRKWAWGIWLKGCVLDAIFGPSSVGHHGVWLAWTVCRRTRDILVLGSLHITQLLKQVLILCILGKCASEAKASSVSSVFGPGRRSLDSFTVSQSLVNICFTHIIPLSLSLTDTLLTREDLEAVTLPSFSPAIASTPTGLTDTQAQTNNF